MAEEMGATYVDTSQGELTYRGWREIAANAVGSSVSTAVRSTGIENLMCMEATESTTGLYLLNLRQS